jgi:hypothetical protein
MKCYRPEIFSIRRHLTLVRQGPQPRHLGHFEKDETMSHWFDRFSSDVLLKHSETGNELNSYHQKTTDLV